MVLEIWLVVFSIYISSSCYGCILKFSRFFKNKFISLKLFDFEKNASWFQKSPNLTILGTTSNWIKFPFFYHLQPLRKCHFISRHPVRKDLYLCWSDRQKFIANWALMHLTCIDFLRCQLNLLLQFCHLYNKFQGNLKKALNVFQ